MGKRGSSWSGDCTVESFGSGRVVELSHWIWSVIVGGDWLRPAGEISTRNLSPGPGVGTSDSIPESSMSRFLQEDCGVRKESLWNMRPQVGVITELLPDCDMGVLVDLALAGEKRFGEGLGE